MFDLFSGSFYTLWLKVLTENSVIYNRSSLEHIHVVSCFPPSAASFFIFFFFLHRRTAGSHAAFLSLVEDRVICLDDLYCNRQWTKLRKKTKFSVSSVSRLVDRSNMVRAQFSRHEEQLINMFREN